MQAMAGDFLSVFRRWSTWYLMAGQDIKLRYRRSLLGPFWISIAMATTIGAITLLYSEVMNIPFGEFSVWFGAGLLGWVFISSMVSEGCSVVVDNEGSLRGVSLPIPLLAARMVHRNLIIFGHNALVVVALLLIIQGPLSPLALLAPLALLVYLPFGLFSAILLGPVCARFRDLAQVVGSVLQVLFFLTPIFWVPGGQLSRPIIVDANPFYHLLQLLRAPLLGEWPTMLNWQVSIGLTVLLGIGALISLGLTRRNVYLWL